ncbi:MAG: Multifunctional CCA protein [Holosporales bacterium]
MKIYKVGGCVRDALLGQAVSDNDYVVVGATLTQMLDLGFKCIGKSFPVFLHPSTHEEYALARKEIKTSPGYKGFSFNVDSTISLEDDLKRRDLTINAIAFDGTDYIDPLDGMRDLKNKILKPVGPAFMEDPVRLLRLARFKARFVDFTLDPLCYTYAQEMKSEMATLSKDRIKIELSKAFQSPCPSLFFKTLKELDVLTDLFPVLINLTSTNLFDLTMQNLDHLSKISNDLITPYALLLQYTNQTEAQHFLESFQLAKQKKFILSFLRHQETLHMYKTASPACVVQLFNDLKIKTLTDESAKNLINCVSASQRLNAFKSTIEKDIETLSKIDFNAYPNNNMPIKDHILKIKIDHLTRFIQP